MTKYIFNLYWAYYIYCLYEKGVKIHTTVTRLVAMSFLSAKLIFGSCCEAMLVKLTNQAKRQLHMYVLKINVSRPMPKVSSIAKAKQARRQLEINVICFLLSFFPLYG